MTPIPPRRGSLRTRFAVAALFIVLAVGGYLLYRLYRSGEVERWFARDSDNPEELDKLKGAALAVPPSATAEIGWPQWQGPFRDARAPAGPLRTDWDKNPPKLVWQAPCGGGFSSLAVVGGKVYTLERQGGNERVICLDAATGQLAWSNTYPAHPAGDDRTYDNGPRATPAIDGNRVYTLGGSGVLMCLQMPDAPGQKAKVLWFHELYESSVPRWGVASSPLIEGNLVIVYGGGGYGTVAAFDKITGELCWRAGSNPPGYSSPVAATVHGVRTIFALTGDALLCVRPDGKLMTSYPWNTRFEGNIATPIVVDDYVFISSAYGQGAALLRILPKGDEIRLSAVYKRANLLQNHHASSVYKDGYLYGFHGDTTAFLKCINLRDGTEKEDWSGPRKKGTLILADRHLIILTQGGELILAEATPEEFRPVATIPDVLSGSRTWALPVLVDGRLYLRDDEKVVCYDVR